MLQQRVEIKLADEAPRKKPRGDESARKLAMAVLIQAFRDIIKPKRSRWPRKDDWYADARAWFVSDEVYPGSYRWCCDALQYDPDRFRVWLRDYYGSTKERQDRICRSLGQLQIPRT